MLLLRSTEHCNITNSSKTDRLKIILGVLILSKTGLAIKLLLGSTAHTLNPGDIPSTPTLKKCDVALSAFLLQVTGGCSVDNNQDNLPRAFLSVLASRVYFRLDRFIHEAI